MKKLFLTNELRGKLKKIWGIPIFGKKQQVKRSFIALLNKRGYPFVITVGDFCSLTLPSDVKIFDLKVQRKKIKHTLPYHLTCKNPPGTLAPRSMGEDKKGNKRKEEPICEGGRGSFGNSCNFLCPSPFFDRLWLFQERDMRHTCHIFHEKENKKTYQILFKM